MTAGPRLPKGALLRFGLLVLVAVAAVAVLRWSPLDEMLDQERLIAAFERLRSLWWAPFAFVLLWIGVSLIGVPVSPLVLAGGAVFGVQLGWICNTAGAVLGASLSFVVAHRLGRDMIVGLLGESRLQRVDALLARHGFWTLVRVRFLPVPFPIINYGAALAGFRFSEFVIASTLGLAPSLFVYTYFSDALLHAAAADRAGVVRNLALALVGVLLLTFFPYLRRLWKRWR